MLIVTFVVCRSIYLKTFSCEWLHREQLLNSNCSTQKYSVFAAWILLYSACQFENVKDSYTVTFLNGLPLTILQKTCPFSSAPSAPTAANCYFALSLHCLRSSGSQGPCWAGALLGQAVCESIATRFPCPKKSKARAPWKLGKLSPSVCLCRVWAAAHSSAAAGQTTSHRYRLM